MKEGTEPNFGLAEKKQRGWLLILVLPYLGLCFPQVYVRAQPFVFGFPFFYWYQMTWVVVTSGILWVFYRRTRRPTRPRTSQQAPA